MSDRIARPIVRRDPDWPNQLVIECEFVEIEVDQDDLLAALAGAEVLGVDRRLAGRTVESRFVSEWKELR